METKPRRSPECGVLFLVTFIYVLAVTDVWYEVWSARAILAGHDCQRLSGSTGVFWCRLPSAALWIYSEEVLVLQFDKLEEMENRGHEVEMDAASEEIIRTTLRENYWEMKPYGRVTGVPVLGPKPYEPVIGLYKIPIWQDGRGIWSYEAFTENGIIFRNGNLVITIPGIYRVYSNVYLQALCKKGVGCPNISESHNVVHAISKFNILDGKEIELTSTTHMPKSPQRDEYRCSFYQSYIETISLLKAGDELSVHVTDLKLLLYPEINYFGVTMM